MVMLEAVIASLFDDSASLMLAMLVFLAAGTAAFSLMAFLRVRGSVKKRAQRLTFDGDKPGNATRSLRYSSLKAVTQLL